MSNTIDGGAFAQYWAGTMNRYHAKKDVYRAISSARFESTLSDGDVVNIPYHGTVWSEGYTRGTAVTVRDVTNVNETLTINVTRVVPMYFDDLDLLQSKYNEIRGYAKKAAEALGNWIDGDVLGEYDVATNDVDDADVDGGTDNNGIVTTTSNILSIFTEAQEAMELLNVFNEGDYFAVISPRFRAKLLAYLAGKETSLGDSTGMNGHIGKFYGFDLYVSNNLGFSARLQMATTPTATDTIVINGITFTYIAALTANGQVHVENSATASTANLTAALNAPFTDITEAAATGYDAHLITTVAGALDGLTATDNTATSVDIKIEGKGWVTVSETLTATASVWTSALQIEHQLFGKKGATDIVVQKKPTIQVRKVSDKIGSNVIPHMMYGLKTTDAGDDELVDVKCTWA